MKQEENEMLFLFLFAGELPGSAGEAGEDEEPLGSGGVDWSLERRVTKPTTTLTHTITPLHTGEL